MLVISQIEINSPLVESGAGRPILIQNTGDHESGYESDAMRSPRLGEGRRAPESYS